jgi:cellulose synthase/poly-beta-1,6-N-acetylglucosamine synthase-like glycosyltransferase
MQLAEKTKILKKILGKVVAKNVSVLQILSQQIIDPNTLYTRFARVVRLSYVSTIDVKINDHDSVVERIGLSTFSKHIFFAQFSEDTFQVFLSDPFQADEVLIICKQSVVFKKHQFYIAQPHIIWSALNQSAYLHAQHFAENTLDNQHPEFSSKKLLAKVPQSLILGIALGTVAAAVYSPVTLFLSYVFLANILYAVLNQIKIIFAAGVFFRKKNVFNPKAAAQLDKSQLPIYTILVPLKNEVESLPDLLAALKKIEYPPEKLDIKFAVEVTDKTTLTALQEAGISVNENQPDPAYATFHVVKVPVSKVSTKPRSCNYALQFARGELVVIYDAEDIPDSTQLYHAYQTFLDSKLNTICIQAKLNYYNPHQNILTRCFAAEYTFWYEVMLPSLEYWQIPLPLGGTSNHFQTNALKAMGNWDAYNVTEDAEVGWRLSRLGYRTVMMDSYTLEEATSQTWSWIKQRTRWQKGFFVTLLVHLQNPKKLVQDLGWRGALSSVLVFSTTVFLPIINMWLWLYFLTWITTSMLNVPFTFFGIPEWLQQVSLINFVFGNVLYIAMHAVGLIYTKKWSLLWILPILPLYWFLQAVGSYRSIWQLIFQPHAWEKTMHGMHKRPALSN